MPTSFSKSGNKQELGVFQLNTDFSIDTAIIFSKLVRNGEGWEYKTIGEGKNRRT